MVKILFVSLGCDKNLADSEAMLGLLAERGYGFTDDEGEADAIVVNTCCFIHDAKEESIGTILEMAEYKRAGSCKALIVTGCLAQRYQEEIEEEIPEVDAIVGTTAFERIAEALEEILAERERTGAGERITAADQAGPGERDGAADQAASGGPGKHRFDKMADPDSTPVVEARRLVTTGGHYAYLKIAEGCDKHCTYCIIPKLRGKFRSVPMERLLKEAGELAEAGVKELILVAQETTLYGKDLYGEKALPGLLKKLCGIEGIRWIRILYCYPEEITDELMEVMAQEEKICRYLDLPVQHASDAILRRMGRRTDREALREVIGKLRSRMPDICIRTTLITGFPGETEKDHEELMAFVNEMEFDRLGVFPYSREEGTPAAEMDGQVPEKVKDERRSRIMELQQEISLENGEKMVGRELTVFIEGKLPDEDAYVARTYRDAPGVDGYLFLNTGEELMSGDFVRARVTGALEYDLIGEMIL